MLPAVLIILILCLVHTAPSPADKGKKASKTVRPTHKVKKPTFEYKVNPFLLRNFVQQATGPYSQHPMPDQHDGDGNAVITLTGMTFNDLTPPQTPPSFKLDFTSCEIECDLPTNRAGGSSSSGGVAGRLNSMAHLGNNRRSSPVARLHDAPHPPLTVSDQDQDRSGVFSASTSTSNAQNQQPAALGIENSPRPPGCSQHNCMACGSDEAWCAHYKCRWNSRLAACF